MPNRELPIYELERELAGELSAQSRLIIQAPTGSGKSTQIPQMLVDQGLAGQGQVVILQPRRLATRMLAKRVAEERSVRLGEEVGYQIRFEDRSSRQTRIKFETEGVLLRQMLTNPGLSGVSAIIFDEFHERHVYGDITLARALRLQQGQRPDLKLLVMSATMEAGPLQKYLDPCRVLSSAGRTFPVTTEYLSKPIHSDEPVWETTAREFERLMRQNVPGDILIFMPGAYEIHRTIQAIQATPSARGFVVLPLHGELPPDAQDEAVARYDRRKVVVATNVAETSLTIDGIRVVIDSGLARMAKYDPFRGINTLLIEKISRASADQRVGRAGRTAPGHGLRLWTEREHAERPLQEIPEIKRIDLSEIILNLKSAGVDDLRAFPWFEAPDGRSLERAERLLTDLGALAADTGRITSLGSRMVSFPVHPRYSRMLLAAQEFRCVRPVALIAALTQGRNLLVRRSGKGAEEAREELLGPGDRSDFFILMRAWSYADRCRYDLERCRRLGIHAATARQIRPLVEYFMNIAQKEGLAIEAQAPADEAIQKCVLAGFADQVACRRDGGTLRCLLVHGRKGELARESVVRESRLFVAAEIREVEGRDQEVNVLLSLATAVEPAWLEELFPGDLREVMEVAWDRESRRVVGYRQIKFRDLALESRRSDEIEPARAAALLAEEVLSGRCLLKGWNEAVEQWIIRLQFVARHFPELGFPEFSEKEKRKVLEDICRGAVSYKDIKDRDPWPALKSVLTPSQQAKLEQLAPERVVLPTGKRARIVYDREKPPVLSATIQDLYDVKSGLSVAGGRVPLIIQVLAPNQRPVQVTQDLAGFWRDAYPKVKKELQRKYPKHEWR